mgnify:CR=1 FL=1
MISIHAPRAGRDSPVWRPGAGTIDFNPRAPCGARPAGAAAIGPLTDFNPRAPCGARRGPEKGPSHASDFNPRAPCGARLVLGAWQRAFGYFNPRAPCGARPPRSAPCRSRHDFNPRAPCGARQQKYTKLLYTLLRQKAIFRQFHAKRRLLKRFSTYKYRNTFLICSANRMGKICTLPLRTTRSLDLPEGMSACSQSARFCFRTFFPSSKTADYPAPDP